MAPQVGAVIDEPLARRLASTNKHRPLRRMPSDNKKNTMHFSRIIARTKEKNIVHCRHGELP